MNRLREIPGPHHATETAAASIDALRARVGAAVARLPEDSETTRRLSHEAEQAIVELSVAFGRVESAIARIDLAATVRLVRPS